MDTQSQEIKPRIAKYLKRNGHRLTTFIGTFDITPQALGEGGNGIVHEAQFERPIAIKFLAEDISKKHSKKYQRFLEEYRRLSTIPAHKGLVRLHNFEHVCMDDMTIPIIIMEKCENNLKSWRKLSAKSGKINLNMINQFISCMCDILNHIHSHGIIHRDIKPENILRRSSGDWVLADFGIAWFDPEVHRIDLTTGPERLANFAFSAPEQIPGPGYREPTPATDLFALGQLIYWLITGDTIKGSNPPLLSGEFGDLNTLVTWLTSQTMEHRPQSVAAFLESISEENREAKTQKHHHAVLHSLETFSECLSRACPGTFSNRDLVSFRQGQDIERILRVIGENCPQHDFIMRQETRCLHLNQILKLGTVDGVENCWLIDRYEAPINAIWIVRSDSYDHDFAVIKLGAMPRFNIYETEAEILYDEAAWFVDRYISRPEYDDGYTLIDGDSVALNGKASVRCRKMKPSYWIICSNYSALGITDDSNLLADLLTSIEKSGGATPDILNRVHALKRHPISQIYA